MKYFSTEFITFFKNLSRNNSTEWFHEHKAIYEAAVKEPFYLFIGDLLSGIKIFDKSIYQTPKEAVLRINRDIRFAADKSPYKLHVSAIISSAGKKGKDHPGMYLEFGAEKIAIYGGAYTIEKGSLQRLRTYLSKNLKQFDKIISEKKFSGLFGEIQGDKNKMLPLEIKILLDQQPLLANKSFYYVAELSAKEITGDNLLQTITKYYQAGKPINDFLRTAMMES